MPTYTVHASPLRPGETKSSPERFLFVRDGFYVWAFLAAPLWLLLHRLWLALIIYLLGCALVGVGLVTLQALSFRPAKHSKVPPWHGLTSQSNTAGRPHLP